MYRGTDGYNYQVKSNSWAKGTLQFTGANTAYFTNKCTVKKINRATGELVEGGGTYTCTVDITDGDLTNPRTPDKFALTILDSGGNVWKQLGTPKSQIPIGGGNVVVHK
jgi:hypothetical protein